MNIVWHGHSLFQITTNPQKNSAVKIVIDPYDKSIGLRVPRLEADILLVTHQHYDHNNIKAVSGNPFLIESPGEYDIKNVFIEGIANFHDEEQGSKRGENIIYVIESENIRICHLGDFGQEELTEQQLEKIGDVDILMIPVGGTYTISAQEAGKIMSQLEPHITIPMHYGLPNLKIKLEPISKFLKAFGLKSLPSLKKLSIKKRDILSDEARIIILEK